MSKSIASRSIALILLPLFHTSCATDPSFVLEPATAPMPERWIASVDTVPQSEISDYEQSETSPSPSPSPNQYSETSVPPAQARVKDLPYGTPVPGKKGLVKSPWSEQGFVDVNGMPPGIEAKCPYSGKVFLVP